MEVSDEMWENSRREFLASLPKDCGIADVYTPAAASVPKISQHAQQE